jgi:hypothetical protein
MSHRSPIFGMVVCILAFGVLGCSVVGRGISRAANNATGGAVSTMESLQSGMATAMATLPAEIPALPQIPGAPGELPGVSPLVPGDGTAAETEGTITGNLSYPSEGIPTLKVVAFDANTRAPIASVETEAGRSTYSLSVPIGAYYVVAYTRDGRLAGGYTFAVLCGLSVECTDHRLVPVGVAPGFAPEGIDPGDWYAPEGTFPPMP